MGMALVYPNRKLPSEKAFATVAISTNADGITGADVLDTGGLALCGISVGTGASDANYTVMGGHTTVFSSASTNPISAIRPLLTSTGGALTLGTTAAGNTPGKALTFDPSLYMGYRYLAIMSGVPGAAIAGQTGVSMGLYLAPRGHFK